MQDAVSILAVDDEPFNLDLIEASFDAYENVTLSYATSGKDALELLEEKEFDVILLDISMPFMNGLEVLQEIRADKRHEYLPVLMVTANPEKEHEAITLGASDFVTKPYDISSLCARTLNYAKLNRYHKQSKNQQQILEEQVQKRTQELEQALVMAKKTEYEISVRLGRASEFRDLETGWTYQENESLLKTTCTSLWA